MPEKIPGYQCGKDLTEIAILLPDEPGLRAHVRRVAALAVKAAAVADWPAAQLRVLEHAALLHHLTLEMLEGDGFVALGRDLGLQIQAGDTQSLLNPQVRNILGVLSGGAGETAEEELTAALIQSANLFDEQFEMLPYEDAPTGEVMRELVESGMLHPLFCGMLERSRLIDLEALLVAGKRLPVFPKAAHQALKIAGNSEAGLDELARVVSRDAVLAGELVKIANSGLYGRSQAFASVAQALMHIGMEAARRSIAAAAIRPCFASAELQSLWRHSLEVSAAAETIAVENGLPDRSEAYLAGLVHDIGRLAYELSPADCMVGLREWIEAGFPLVYAEMLISGTDHAAVGAVILKAWHFPAHIVEAVECHHRPERTSVQIGGVLFESEIGDESLPSLARHHRASKLIGIGKPENVAPRLAANGHST